MTDKPSFLFDKSLIIRQIPFFSGLNFFEKRIVLDALQIVEYKKSESIYHQGTPADGFYCIITGRVQIYIQKDAFEETLEYIHRGKYFGFLSLLTGETHSVSARAVNDTVIAKISKEDFDTILKSIPRLAIELSLMLSRRLKRKDVHSKSIFESTIISVYSDEDISDDRSLYAFNLALGLKTETQKKVVLVDLGAKGSLVDQILGIDSAPFLKMDDLLIQNSDVLKKIGRFEKGIDVLRVAYSREIKSCAPYLIALLTMLVNDYHYCIISLDSHCGQDIFQVLGQSDKVHLVSSQDRFSLKKLFKEMESFGVWMDAELKKKIKLIILEKEENHGKGSGLFYEQEAALFHQPVFATLPKPKDHLFLVSDDPGDPYSKVIRRISRQLGEVLVGLALGSGSAMGLSHIGVLKVLEKEGIPIDIVVGSSIGAFIGALWCCGYTACEIEEIILKNKNKKYIFGLDDLTFPLHGLIGGKHVKRFLHRYLGDKTFYDLKRPFKVVGTDCMSMKQVVFDSGKLTDVVLASVSIPGVFVPYKIGGRYYIDGGILNPLPTNVLVESGAKKIIAVNVLPSAEDIERTYELSNREEKESAQKKHLFSKFKKFYTGKVSNLLRPNIFDVIVSSVQSIEYLLAQMSALSQSDVTLHPDMTAVSWHSFENASDLIKRGEEETLLHLKEIKDLLAQPD